MAKDVEILVIYDNFPEIAAAMEKVVSQIVRKAAFDIQALAASYAPVDTGFLKSSIYVVTADSSTYAQGVDATSGDGYLLDEVEAPASKTEAIVAVGANYGVYQEMGTVNMSAQPYLTPAAELVKPTFVAAMSELETYLKGLGAAGE